MRLVLGLLVTTLLAAVQMAVVAAETVAINGWYDCSIYTFESQLQAPRGTSDDVKEQLKLALPKAECALIDAPLCHDTVTCKSKKTIQLFVKRILGTMPKSSPDVWFIQGGPGASSEAMERGMQYMFAATKGLVNVYTVDHRGTGRSNKFDCKAAQATTSGSPGGEGITIDEFPSCSADLNTQYGDDLSSFSITSAASDLQWLISALKSKAGTFVYSVSYGTAVVERLMHLKVDGIAGYILDSVATSSGSHTLEYFSSWDLDFGAIGDRFLEVCKRDSFCGSKFGTKGPAQTLKDLYTRLDSSSNGLACTGLENSALSDGQSDSSSASTRSGPVQISLGLRKLFGVLLQDMELRTLIPALIYRMDRCQSEDKKVLRYFFNKTLDSVDDQSHDESAAYQSSLLYKLITFSEMWEFPPPRLRILQQRFTGQLITNGAMYTSLLANCLFRLDTNSSACRELGFDKSGISSKVKPIAYQRDEFWNKSAKVPSGATVLIMNGKLDPQTHYRYAQLLYDAIDGKADSQKKLLLFEYLAHSTAFHTASPGEKISCGMQVLVSYIVSGGKLSEVKTACMNNLPAPQFKVDPAIAEQRFGTRDVYSGELAAGLDDPTGASSSSIGDSETYKTLFIVFVLLFVVAVGIIGYLVFRARNSRKNQTAKEHLQQAQASDIYMNASAV